MMTVGRCMMVVGTIIVVGWSIHNLGFISLIPLAYVALLAFVTGVTIDEL